MIREEHCWWMDDERLAKKIFGVETTRQKTGGKAQKEMERWSGRSA